MMTKYTQPLSDCREVAEVGGKGANLGKLVRAGFAVPDGFVVTTTAYRTANSPSPRVLPPVPSSPLPLVSPSSSPIPQEIAQAIRQAYRALGSGPVAVRSSATAEDMAAASMAGQYETFLDIRGEEYLLEKIQHCWASLDSPRTRAYLAEHGIDPAAVAMGVVVQKLVPADVAGVLFTINPNGSRAGRNEMLIEASWGLGESVVSGKVQPDVVRADAATGQIIEMIVAEKKTMLAAGSHAEIVVDAPRRKAACLSESDVQKLCALGKKAAAHFAAPQDLEWAISGGELFLLQSRPITTHLEAELKEEVLQAAREIVNSAGNGAVSPGPWVLHNLAETRPPPTPLTWSVIQPFMSGSGGFGNMYRMAGFQPGPAVSMQTAPPQPAAAPGGFLVLLAGRIYMDASRAPEMFFEKFPFAYDLEELKRTPDASQTPPTLPRGSLRQRMRAGKRLAAVNATLHQLAETFDRDFRDQHVPELKTYVQAARAIDLRYLASEALIDLWQQHRQRIMDRFAPLSLLPSLICGMALAELKSFLEEHLWEEDAEALTQTLSAGGIANRTVMANADLYELAHGDRGVQSWLDEHGHRGAGEFDLAAPRWREKPAALLEMAARLAEGEKPLERHRRSAEKVNQQVAAIQAKLQKQEGPATVAEFDRRLDLVRRYIPFREDGKDFLMLGYELLRATALEFGRRLNLGEDIFYLTEQEMLAGLAPGSAGGQQAAALSAPTLTPNIDHRKRRHRAKQKTSLPRVIAGPQDLAEPASSPIPATGAIRGFAISGGRARGKARILRSPTEAGILEKGYILICPSTDPSWTPLFVNAAALILEVGGTLSHGAVVAREMGLPAVVLPDATRMFTDGEEVEVDGTGGWIGRAGVGNRDETSRNGQKTDIFDINVAHDAVPPVPGPKDRRAAKIRNISAVFWAFFVIAFFLLPPAWVHNPTLVFLDHLLWPLVRTLGKPCTVAIVAALIAVTTLTLQKLLTDNRRLLEAKRRARLLTKEADHLPAGSPRQRALRRLAAPVQARVLMAALVPVGILLGPMVLPFAWFKDRVDPAAWNAPAGTPVEVVAYIDPNWSAPVTLAAANSDAGGPAIAVDDATPVAQSVPPVRPVLEQLLALYQSPAAGDAWQIKAGPELPRAQAAAELKAYLDKGVPAQALRWRLVPPENAAGKFLVTVSTAQFSTQAFAVVGDAYAPAPKVVSGGGLIRELRLNYGQASTEKIFWRPFGFLAGSGGFFGKLGAWDAGWVWVYILAYLPVLFGVRAAMKVA